MNLFDLPQSFHRNVMPVTESGCWIWLGGVHDKGYGAYSRKPEKPILAHRFAYLTLKGSIPEPLQLDHLCRVRLCVNPDHLEAVTRRENILRGISPAACAARRTHCAKGHPLAGQNLMLDSGHRRCVTCRTEYERLRNLRRYTPQFGRIKSSPKTGRVGLKTVRFSQLDNPDVV